MCGRDRKSSPGRPRKSRRPASRIRFSRKSAGVEGTENRTVVKNAYRILRMALRALRRNIMRSVLTCLGIIIGIAAVIAMMEIGRGSSYSIEQTIASLGANVIQVDPNDAVIGGVSSGGGGRVTLTPAHADAILQDCSAGRWVAPSASSNEQIVYAHPKCSPINVLAPARQYLMIRQFALKAGEPFTH